MKLKYLEKPSIVWFVKTPKSKEFPRHWKTVVDIEVTLSDGYVLKVANGATFDGASIPKLLWWLFKPVDAGVLGDWIHDELWKDKQGQFKNFDYKIFKARKFADEERLRWRNALAPNKKFKNWITHGGIRLIGGVFYSNQLNIPT